MARAKNTRAPLGRPRAKPRKNHDQAPREEILLAAARLFTSLGYSKASTRQIAEAVSLRQASLFYYFSSKEDILAELLDRTVQPALDFASRLGDLEAAAAPRLYLLAYNDLRNYCRPPGNLGSLQLQHEAKAKSFDSFWAKREQLRAVYEDLIAEGVERDRFQVTDIALTTAVVFGQIESVTTWFEPGREGPEVVWHAVAEAALRMVTGDGERTRQIRAEAESLAETLAPTLQTI